MRHTLALSFAALVLVSGAALAQNTGTVNGNTGTQNAINGPNGGKDDAKVIQNNREANGEEGMTCQAMMDKATPMMDTASAGQKRRAMAQIKLAKADMDKDRETACMTHMHTAMNDMK